MDASGPGALLLCAFYLFVFLKSLMPRRADAPVLRAAAAESIRSGDFVEAEKRLLRLIRYLERHYGREALELVSSLGDLARLYTANNFLALAETVYQRILAIEVKNVGSESCDLAPTLYEMAQLAHRRRMFQVAEVLARRIPRLKPAPDIAASVVGTLRYRWRSPLASSGSRALTCVRKPCS